MFGLGMMSTDNFLTYSTQFTFLIIKLVTGNVVMVAIDMSERAPSRVIKYMTYAKTCVTFYVFSLFIYLFV